MVSVTETISHWVKWNKCATEPESEKLPNVGGDDTSVIRKTFGSNESGFEVVLLQVKGGGHTWPQGFQYLPEREIGRLSQSFNANEIIWEFFKNTMRLTGHTTNPKPVRITNFGIMR